MDPLNIKIRALTARLVRDNGNDNYKEIGEKVDEELRFTYLYPSTEQEKVDLWPWKDPDEFSWKHFGSYTSASLKDRTAEEGMLHETEYISMKTRDGEQVFLVGYVFEKAGCELRWKDALKRIQIGGELGNGWGQVEVNYLLRQNNSCFYMYIFDGTQDTPQITVQKGNTILAHALIDNLECKGTIEPFVGRETTERKGFGGSISSAKISYIPGSIVNDEATFIILPRGIWSNEKNRNDSAKNISGFEIVKQLLSKREIDEFPEDKNGLFSITYTKVDKNPGEGVQK